MSPELWGFFGEEFRNLRTKVAHAFGEERHKIVLVTSAVSNEGKTTVSTHLARSFSQTGWKTLLVDCDLRYPELHNVFRVDQGPGLGELLQGKAAEEEAVIATDLANLDLVTAGTTAESPAELFNSAEVPRLLQGLVSRYDYIVLDCPPLISITDTLLLARHADGLLLVINGYSTPREVVKTAADLVQDRRVLGAVLVGIATPRKYGYYY